MPSWNTILNELGTVPSAFDKVRRSYIRNLANKTGRNVIIYYSGWLEKKSFTLDFGINDADMTGFMTTISKLDLKKGLDLVLHTPGGEIAATEHLVEYLKDCFNNDIRVIVPQIAMSAGTMIALASKEILMGNYSNLGPIDPQLNGLATHGILEEYERAKKELKKDLSLIPVWQVALSKYPPTLIGECEKAIKWSEDLVGRWLKEGMYKTQNGDKVETIVKELSDHGKTKAHSRHISLKTVKKLGLNVVDLAKDKDLQDKVLSVHHSSIITLAQTKAYKIIENHLGKSYIKQVG